MTRRVAMVVGAAFAVCVLYVDTIVASADQPVEVGTDGSVFVDCRVLDCDLLDMMLVDQ